MTAMQSLIEQFSNTEEKIVQIGSFQPYELVRVHHNPTDLILTNEHEHTIAGTAVVLLDDGQERTGLKFKPNISNISQRNESVKLILASTIAQSISVEYGNYPAKQFDLEANKPVVVIIGEMFGIPMLESTANFFDAVGGGNQPVNGWTTLNASYDGSKLVYTDGDINFAWPTGRQKAFSLSKQLVQNEKFSFDLPNYEIEGKNPYQDIFALVSQSDVASSAYNNRNQAPYPPNTSRGFFLFDFTNSGGSNSGLSLMRYVDGGNSQDNIIHTTSIHVEVTVLENAVSVSITDKDTNQVTTQEYSVPNLMAEPDKYLHMLVILKESELPTNLSLIELPLVVYGEQQAGNQ